MDTQVLTNASSKQTYPSVREVREPRLSSSPYSLPSLEVPLTSISTVVPLRKDTSLYRAGKRFIDIVGALAGLILLFPVFLIVGLMVALDSRGPVFHRRQVLARQSCQERDCSDISELETLDAFKFRTMVVNADEVLQKDPALWEEYRKDFKLQNDPRVTRIGGRLRRTSVDELPQLLNVLRGQMSLVGPRMITPAELHHYGPNAAKLLTVKPGITGLWQVSGRSNVTYNERVRLDMYYIDNRSLRLDLEILWRTVICVLQRRGAV
jgi:lipopolysaccharide/colanic/teichoic acid biosynthesis glycosyltransferase